MLRQPSPLNKRAVKLVRRIQRSMEKCAQKVTDPKNGGRCPHCKTLGDQHPWGSYERWLRMKVRGRRCDVSLQVPRVRCGACERTYAVLGPGIVPYRWYSVDLILKAVSEYLSSRKTVCEVCRSYGIASSTLYRWLKMARLHFRLLEGLVRGTDDNLAKLSISRGLNWFLRTFLHRFHRVFLEHLRI